MGQERPDRQLRQGWVAFASAVRRAKHDLDRFDNCGIGMDPGPDLHNPIEWTRGQRAIIRSAAGSWLALLERTQEWDGLCREYGRMGGSRVWRP